MTDDAPRFGVKGPNIFTDDRQLAERLNSELMEIRNDGPTYGFFRKRPPTALERRRRTRLGRRFRRAMKRTGGNVMESLLRVTPITPVVTNYPLRPLRVAY